MGLPYHRKKFTKLVIGGIAFDLIGHLTLVLPYLEYNQEEARVDRMYRNRGRAPDRQGSRRGHRTESQDA
ncbi:MAG: hypothetical protein D6690_03175 [Nitrospirae bacterium]|nr:MAG: hypothetical protein D6690_03175 [Nitrospirota bacterium]